MSRARVVAPFLAVLATVTAMAHGPLPASTGSTGTGCTATSAGAIQWLGGPGSWSDPAKWSGGQVPGIDGRADEACIPPGAAVVLDSASPRIDLAVLELGRGSRLTLQPGTALFVWGDQDSVRSVTRSRSVVEVDGATLGGAGRLRVMGTLVAHRSAGGSRAILTTRPVSSSVTGRPGILEIGDRGTLRVDGSGNVRLAKQYVVDVRGRTLLREDGGLVADHGTSFLLQRKIHTRGVGRLVILNDRGFAEGAWQGVKELATFVNRGLIVKRESTGTSTVVARYVSGGRELARTGVLELPVPVVFGPPATDTCDTPASCNPSQEGTLKIPVTDTDGAVVVVEPLDGVTVKGAVGVPMKVHATGLDATLADPAVIQLRYVRSLFTAAGVAADPGKLTVAHADGPDDPYVDIPVCVGRSIPLGAVACLDRQASFKTAADVLLVVRTIDTSRWVAR